jgi:hypothetical protein
MKISVIIPLYKEKLTDFERVSLVQCCKILNKYDFSLICPSDLNIGEYTGILDSYNINYKTQEFDKSFFESTKTYNLLMLSADFYKRFSAYDFILIYQLDAYVFRDELDYWCEQGYDFIGAPWNRFDFLRNKLKLLDAGVNGGFSLRKIPSFIEVLELGGVGKGKEIMNKFIKGGRNEDGFFSVQAKMIDPAFKVAPLKMAMNFSFEQKPEKLYEMTNHKLPFGCHAWAKYNPQFWKRFILVGDL